MNFNEVSAFSVAANFAALGELVTYHKTSGQVVNNIWAIIGGEYAPAPGVLESSVGEYRPTVRLMRADVGTVTRNDLVVTKTGVVYTVQDIVDDSDDHEITASAQRGGT